MNDSRIGILTAILAACSLSCLCGPSGAAELAAGVVVRDITPPVGYRMCGYFRERLNTGTHDPLQAKAMVLRQGNESAALVFCDLASIAREVSDRARDMASERTGIPAANILIAATHSHTGPLYFGALRNRFHEVTVAEHGEDLHEPYDYAEKLARKLAEAIAAAHACAQPVSIEAGTAQQAGLSFNRRFHMKGDGPVRFNPGKLNPNIVRVAGPIDPEVGILLARDADERRPLFSLTVFPLHLDTVGGTDYSADYPLYVEQTIRQEFGSGFVSVFGQGTCGDINHVDVSHKRPQKGQVEAERIGSELGQTVLAAIPGLESVDTPSLAVRSVMVDVPLRPCTSEEVARARTDIARVGDGKVPFLERVATYRIMAQQLREGKTVPLEVQVFRLSDGVAVVGLPGEVFVELGLAIKEQSPFATTLVVELANDSPHYVPTEKAIAEGSYETVNRIIDSGGGELLVDAATALLDELAPAA